MLADRTSDSWPLYLSVQEKGYARTYLFNKGMIESATSGYKWKGRLRGYIEYIGKMQGELVRDDQMLPNGIAMLRPDVRLWVFDST